MGAGISVCVCSASKEGQSCLPPGTGEGEPVQEQCHDERSKYCIINSIQRVSTEFAWDAEVDSKGSVSRSV